MGRLAGGSAGPGILRQRGWADGSCGRGPVGLVVGCRNCGQSYVWLPPSTWQMGHQFIASAWPIKAREYNSGLVVDQFLMWCMAAHFLYSTS